MASGDSWKWRAPLIPSAKLGEPGHEHRPNEDSSESQADDQRDDSDQPQHHDVYTALKEQHTPVPSVRKRWLVEPHGLSLEEVRLYRADKTDHQEDHGCCYGR